VATHHLVPKLLYLAAAAAVSLILALPLLSRKPLMAEA
jgi:hypothetical protein